MEEPIKHMTGYESDWMRPDDQDCWLKQLYVHDGDDTVIALACITAQEERTSGHKPHTDPPDEWKAERSVHLREYRIAQARKNVMSAVGNQAITWIMK